MVARPRFKKTGPKKFGVWIRFGEWWFLWSRYHDLEDAIKGVMDQRESGKWEYKLTPLWRAYQNERPFHRVCE